MTYVLDDLLNDARLARLFSKDPRPCALEFWVLQIKSEHSIENRVVYGRLLPYSHFSDRWASSEDDNFHTFGQVQAQIVRLHLYVKSTHCADLLRQLSAGRTVSAISEELKFEISDRLKARFGAVALAAENLVYRPVAYLLNRDAHDLSSPSSPHGGAGAFSASIARTDKAVLFRLGSDYSVALTEFVIERLDAATGLNFGNGDTARFGELELLVFPSLDDSERPLLWVRWDSAQCALVARFNPKQVPHFSSFLFCLSIENDRQIVYSRVATAERGADGAFECKFQIGDQLRACTDSTNLEIFGFHSDQPDAGALCCRWQVGYIRELQYQGHLVGRAATPVKFDWLEKATRPSASARVKAALTINRGDVGFVNSVGGRKADPWVSANRDLASVLARLHPPKSEGQFFLRWGQGDGEGRIQFVEWFRALLNKYQQHQIVIFDPYFEAAGLGLMLVCAAQTADHVVFRSLPKPPANGNAAPSESEKAPPDSINNLMASCERNLHLLKRIKLRIYGLKQGRLHDRYILIMGADSLPIAGFNLSNSFQTAAENYPLLVTPIPSDTLLKVEEYKSGLVKEAAATQSEGAAESAPMQLLFNSRASATTPEPRRHEPLGFLEKARAGDVLGQFTAEGSLLGLSGEPLKERMIALQLLKNNSLSLPEVGYLRNCLNQQAADLAGFTATWEVLAEVLAHSSVGDRHFREIESEQSFLGFLEQFLKASFNRAHSQVQKELAVVDPKLFGESIENLLRSPYPLEHLFHTTKYAGLTWAEYFAVRFLWWYAPNDLLAIAEVEVADVSTEPQSSDGMRLCLLSQIVGEISLSVQFDISEEQRSRLLASSNGLLKWMGMNAIERQLEKQEQLAATLQTVNTFPYPDRVQVLGWMTSRAARIPKKAEIYNGLVAALHGTLPGTIPADELRRLVDSMRGNTRQRSWSEPWLFQDVILPLLKNGRVNPDDACEIWILELATLLEPKFERQPRMFDRAREGQTTNIAAFLFANSSPEQQQASLSTVKAILKRQQRIIQQPLASTSDWTRWDGALVISMWILAFARWSQYYLRERDMADRELEGVTRSARDLAMIRPIDEWRSMGVGEQAELPAFLDQVEELLASGDESKTNVNSRLSDGPE